MSIVDKAIEIAAREISYATKTIKRHNDQIQWLNANRETLEQYPLQDRLNINEYWMTWEGTAEHPITHEQCIELIKFFGGKWIKGPDWSGTLFNYDREDQILDRPVRIVSQPPPSCKIVEEEVEIPAHKAMKKRIVCPTNEEQVESNISST